MYRSPATPAVAAPSPAAPRVARRPLWPRVRESLQVLFAFFVLALMALAFIASVVVSVGAAALRSRHRQDLPVARVREAAETYRDAHPERACPTVRELVAEDLLERSDLGGHACVVECTQPVLVSCWP